MNALTSDMSFNETKIKSSEWQSGWIEFPFNHLIIAFDSDQEATDKGFRLNYRILSPDGTETWEDSAETLEVELENLYQNVLVNPVHIERMARIHENLFSKFNGLMQRCRNGSQMDSIHPIFDPAALTDPTVAKGVWVDLMKNSFDVCDLPITRNGFDNSSWKTRVDRYFDKLNRLIAKQ